jgi:hypothetical protein
MFATQHVADILDSRFRGNDGVSPTVRAPLTSSCYFAKSSAPVKSPIGALPLRINA